MKLIKLALNLKSEGKPALSEYLVDMIKSARSNEYDVFCSSLVASDACLRTLLEFECISLYDYCYTFDCERKKIIEYLVNRYFHESL